MSFLPSVQQNSLHPSTISAADQLSSSESLASQTSSTSSTNSSPSTNVYRLEGGATVYDKTGGIAKAIFSRVSEEGSLYEVFIHGKKLIYPTCSDPSIELDTLTFRGSKTLTFVQEDEFIKINEVDENSETILYVDPSKPVKNLAYDIYQYAPKELRKEDTVQKVKNLMADFTSFKPYKVLYNRHGVAAFGWDETRKSYGLYWANPYQEKMSKMECSKCEHFRDGGSAIAKSTDGSVNFRFTYPNSSFLNGEPATRL